MTRWRSDRWVIPSWTGRQTGLSRPTNVLGHRQLVKVTGVTTLVPENPLYLVPFYLIILTAFQLSLFTVSVILIQYVPCSSRGGLF